MIGQFFIITSLGLAGIDPVGMLLLMGGLMNGFGKRQSWTYILSVFIGTAIFGTVLSAIFGSSLSQLIDHAFSKLLNLHVGFWVLAYLIVITCLIVWGIKRLYRKEKNDDGKVERGSHKGLGGMVAFMVFSAIVDPSFLAVLVISGRHGIALAFLYNLIWGLTSQLPLLLLSIAIFQNHHERFVDKWQKFTNKYSTTIRFLVTGLIFMGAFMLILDLSTYLITGEWLIG